MPLIVDDEVILAPLIGGLGEIGRTKSLVGMVRIFVTIDIGDLGAVAGQAEYQIALLARLRSVDHRLEAFHDIGLGCQGIGLHRDIDGLKAEQTFQNRGHVIGVVDASLQRCEGTIREMIDPHT